MVIRRKWVDEPVLYESDDSGESVSKKELSTAGHCEKNWVEFLRAPPTPRPDEPVRSPDPQQDFTISSSKLNSSKLIPHQLDEGTATRMAAKSSEARISKADEAANNLDPSRALEIAHVCEIPPQGPNTKPVSQVTDRQQQILDNLEKRRHQKKQAEEAVQQAQLSAIEKARAEESEYDKHLQLSHAEQLEETAHNETSGQFGISEVDIPLHPTQDWVAPPNATRWSNTWGEIDATEVTPNVSERDPRGQELTMPSVRIDWNATRPKGKQGRNWSVQSASSLQGVEVDGELSQFVYWWMAKIPVTTVSKRIFTQADHYLRDIHVETGKLLEPIEYPDVLPASVDQVATVPQTSTDAIADKWEGRSYQRPSYAHENWDEQAGVDSTRATLATAPAGSETKLKVSQASLKSTDVKIRCHLRPAAKADMLEVREIYNHEIRTSHRTLDSQEMTLNDFHELFDKCKAEKMPFLVAVDGHGKPGSDWPLNVDDKIIGFALVDTLEHGLWGSRDSCSSTCGRVTLVVHPQYRGLRVGTALLDMIMKSCSCLHQSWEGYTWVQPDPTDLEERFVEPLKNPRKWYSLFFEVLIKSGESHDQLKKHDEWWVCEWLENRFHAFVTERKERLYQHTSNDQKRTYWLDRIMLQHSCRSWNS